MPVSLRPLKRPVFALFWVAGLVSDAGTWMQLLTVGTLIAANGGSAASTAMVAAATFGPQGLASPIGGLLADRFDRRRLFLAGLGLQTVITFVLAAAIAAGQRNANVLALIVLAQSASGAVAAPSFQSILPDLVAREELLAASSLGMLAWNTGRIVGPLLAGVLAAVGLGPAWAVLANAVSFLVLWLAVASVRRTFRTPNRPHSTWFEELRDGAGALARTPGCRFVIAGFAVLHLTVVPFMGLLPHMAIHVLDQPRSFANLLASAQGIGAVIGALVIPGVVFRHGRSRTLTVVALCTAAASVAYVTSTGRTSALVAIAFLGAGCAMTMTCISAINSRDAPHAHRGRIFSLFSASNGIGYGGCLLGFGEIIDRVGMQPPFLIGALVLTLCTLSVKYSPRLRSVIDHGDPPRRATPSTTSARASR